MKFLTYIVAAAVGFCAVTAATLYFKGALNKETLASLIGKETQEEEIASPTGEPLLPLATALKEKEKQIAQRAQELKVEEDRIKQEWTVLEAERKTLEGKLKEMQTQLAALDQEEMTRLTELAKTYQEMNSQTAARILEQMPVDDVVKILRQITKAKDRAKIVENMRNSLAISKAIMSGTEN